MLSFYDRAKAMIRSADPVEIAAVKSANQGILSCKGVSGAIHVNQTLSNLSIQYANQAFIGLQLMPILTVSKTSGNFKVYGKSDRLAVPDDSITKRGRANEVSETRTDDTYTCVGRALENFVDEQDLMDQDAPLNEMLDLTQSVNDGLDLAEELRIATVLTTTWNFGGNTATLTGSDRWDSSTGGNPVKNIQDASNAVWMGLGATKKLGYCSLGVFSVLQRHPAVLDLFKNVTAGLATRQMLAQIFGLDDLLVGGAWEDTANSGQSASYGRAWANSFGIVRVAANPSPRCAAFGFTFRCGQKRTTQWYDQAVGVEGGYYSKVGHYEDHKVVAPTTGYLLATVIS